MDAFFRAFVGIAAVSLLGLGGMLSYQGQPAEAAATYAAAIIALIFFFLAKFKRFKGLGIEAEMWEGKMEEAEQLVDNLRSLAEAVAEPIYSMAARHSRMGTHFTPWERHQLVQRMDRVLQRAGVSADAVEAAKRDLHRINVFDMLLPIIDAMKKALQDRITQIEEEMKPANRFAAQNPAEMEAKRSRLQPLWDAKQRAKDLLQSTDLELIAETAGTLLDGLPEMPEEMVAAIKAQTREDLADLRHYVAHKQFRRPEVWFGRR